MPAFPAVFVITLAGLLLLKLDPVKRVVQKINEGKVSFARKSSNKKTRGRTSKAYTKDTDEKEIDIVVSPSIVAALFNVGSGKLVFAREDLRKKFYHLERNPSAYRIHNTAVRAVGSCFFTHKEGKDLIKMSIYLPN